MADDIFDEYAQSLENNEDDDGYVDGLQRLLGGLLGDAMAETRSRRQKWRARECAALCVKMVASAPHIRGQAMDHVQVLLIPARLY